MSLSPSWHPCINSSCPGLSWRTVHWWMLADDRHRHFTSQKSTVLYPGCLCKTVEKQEPIREHHLVYVLRWFTSGFFQWGHHRTLDVFSFESHEDGTAVQVWRHVMTSVQKQESKANLSSSLFANKKTAAHIGRPCHSHISIRFTPWDASRSRVCSAATFASSCVD